MGMEIMTVFLVAAHSYVVYMAYRKVSVRFTCPNGQAKGRR